MRVAVDYAQCQGHARCVMIAPDLFDLDEQGKSQPPPHYVPDALVELADEAVNGCPERAISVVRADVARS